MVYTMAPKIYKKQKQIQYKIIDIQHYSSYHNMFNHLAFQLHFDPCDLSC